MQNLLHAAVLRWVRAVFRLNPRTLGPNLILSEMSQLEETAEDDGSRVSFKDKDMRLLINLRIQYDKEFQKKNQKHDIAWKMVLKDFLDVNPTSKVKFGTLRTKWNYLKTTYNQKKTAVGKSGAGADKWKWYSMMDDFCGDGADVVFANTAATIGGPSVQNLPQLKTLVRDRSVHKSESDEEDTPRKKRTKTEEILHHQKEQAVERRKCEESLKADREEIKALLKTRADQSAEKNFYLKALVEHTIGRALQYEPSITANAVEEAPDADGNGQEYEQIEDFNPFEAE